MAIYRNISMNFWTDTKVVDEFSPEDKYFMLYCLTNQYTNLCGCYEISIKQMTRDTGYNEETIIKLLDRFKNKYNIIDYNKQNKEIYIKNWYRYNWTKSEKLDKPLLNEITNIKTVDFKKRLVDLYNKRDTVSIPYTYPMDTTVSVTDTDTVSDIYKEVINYLNEKTNKNFKYTSNSTQKHINARINEGYTIEDLKKVIDIKTNDWLNNNKMSKYLRPETLFGSKFENYINEKNNVPEWYDKDIKINVSQEDVNEMNKILEELGE